MLGHYWRAALANTQNQAITCTVKARLWKYASDGSITYSAEQTLVSSQSVSASTGTHSASNVDNSSDKYIGAEFTVSIAAASATNGTGALTLLIERSTDGGTTWPTAGKGTWVGGYTLVSGDGTSTRVFNATLS